MENPMTSKHFNSEVNVIKESIKNVIKKCQDNPSKAKKEIIVQDWLYNEICDALWKINPREQCRLREEYSLFKHAEENEKLPNPKQYWKEKYPRHLEHEKRFKFDGKAGKIDLVVLDETREKILHAIEIKEITKCCKSQIHRGYEDIYILSDLLKMHNEIANGYILIIA